MSVDHAIVTLTINPCLDVSGEVDAMAPTKKLRCHDVLRDPGGGGINVSRAVSLLGGRSMAIFPAGGSTGRSIGDMLTQQQIESHPVHIDDMTRESFSVRVTKSGEQYRFVLPGPELREEEWQQCIQAVAGLAPGPDFLVVSGSLPPGVPADFYTKLAEHFSGSSTKIILDTSGEPLKRALEIGVYLIKPNRRELEEICDCSLSEEKDQEKVCRNLVDSGRCEALALSLGRDGALLTTRDDQLRVAGLEVKEVSSVGAGDSFVGAMILGLHQGKQLHEAFLYGMAAGTAALLTEGTELCRKDDTEKIFRKLEQNRKWL
ncbi:MAG: 1-phosphofructokinase family hexose kinase [Desulfobulbaceae bacterium]|nr:1-phosphofructokinase family hexose kinase [Desulfobulbaceae bacterium]